MDEGKESLKAAGVIAGVATGVVFAGIATVMGLRVVNSKMAIDTILRCSKDKIENEVAPETAQARIFKYRNNLFEAVYDKSTLTLISKKDVLSCMKEQASSLIVHLPIDQKEWNEGDKKLYEAVLGDIKEASACETGLKAFQLIAQKMMPDLRQIHEKKKVTTKEKRDNDNTEARVDVKTASKVSRGKEARS